MSATGQSRTVWRVTVETVSGFTIGTGGGDDLRDSVCVTDANGLPSIPGSSIAGVLRSAVGRSRGEPFAQALFGHMHNDGQASRVEVSWAQVHDGRNRPVPLRSPDLVPDKVLEFLRVGVTRDHVRINGRGVVDGAGKFDETLVPVGARFTFELQLVNGTDEEEAELVRVLEGGALRMGGRTRMGHGLFKVVSLRGRRFKLAESSADLEAWLSLGTGMERSELLPAWTGVVQRGQAGMSTLQLTLQPQDYWLVGGGEPHERYELARGEVRRVADIVPVTEAAISWSGDVGSVAVDSDVELLLPATSVKGAIRHRFEFLARCRGEAKRALVDEVFGALRGGEQDGEDVRGGTGCVYFTDARLKLKDRPSGFQEHVCIDRFSGAPMSGMLFSEAPRYRGRPVEITVHVVDGRISSESREILKEALRDLARGRLALGGGANRGHGYFEGTLKVLGGDAAWEQP